MFVLFTDFGLDGPYLGQMKAVLHAACPANPIVDLLNDAPRGDPRASAYLLAAYDRVFAPGTIFICVVDPGVGTHRRALLLEADDRVYVGPDNGLLSVVAVQAERAQWREILWRPQALSASFHGRDLFAPAAARLARRATLERRELADQPPLGADWPADLAEIVYVDHFGNALTGLRASQVPGDAEIEIAAQRCPRAATFADVPSGSALWYENANGLVEIAVNQGRADTLFDLRIGDAVHIVRP